MALLKHMPKLMCALIHILNTVGGRTTNTTQETAWDQIQISDSIADQDRGDISESLYSTYSSYHYLG